MEVGLEISTSGIIGNEVPSTEAEGYLKDR